MPRDSNIPLFLWIATAILAHLAWGGGADRVSHLIEQRLDMQAFARAVQRHVRMQDQPIQVALLEKEDKPKPKPAEADKEQPPEKEPEKDPEKERDKKKPKHQQDTKKKVKPEKAKPIIVPRLMPAKKAAPAKKKPGKKAKPLPVIKHMNRIAVRQHVKDKNQKDNPTAEFIADQANKVAKQTQARITSTDRNDAHPTPGGHHSGPNQQPGDSDHTRIAQSENRPGAPDLAPNDPGKQEPKKVAMARIPPPPPARPARTERPSPPRSSTLPAQNGQKAQKAVAPTAASPDTVHAPGGSFSVAEAANARKGHKARKARKRRLPPRKSHDPLGLLGLGAPGRTRDGVQLNLTPRAALAVIGKKELVRERRLDAERRKSAHLGSWKSIGIQRWRSAIENYVPSVKPGNQTALNTARVPFASYINSIHNRIHPIFADSFLASLDNLPKSNPMNRPDISTNLEIVLSPDDGHIVRMGVTKTSGVTAFDVAALESVQRASPFGAAPKAIVSPDGRVYLHWEFWRNPYYACSTYFARPYILKVKPKPAPPEVQPPPTHPYDPRERPGHDRQGRRAPREPALEKQAALR